MQKAVGDGIIRRFGADRLSPLPHHVVMGAGENAAYKRIIHINICKKFCEAPELEMCDTVGIMGAGIVMGIPLKTTTINLSPA